MFTVLSEQLLERVTERTENLNGIQSQFMKFIPSVNLKFAAYE